MIANSTFSPRKRGFVLATVFLFFIVYVSRETLLAVDHGIQIDILPTRTEQQPIPVPSEVAAAQNKAVWNKFMTILKEHRPPIPPLSISKHLNPFQVQDLPKNVDDVPDVIDLSEEDQKRMKQAHLDFVATTKNSGIELNYAPGTKGIVSTAAEKDLGSVVMTMRMLRRTGCTLPAEIMVLSEDVAKSPMCAEVLRPLNATCIATDPSIGSNHPELDNNRYLNKLFALIFSSFDDNLFLDADNLPVMDPTPYFHNEPYSSHGLVAWPDFWPSSISHRHKDITSTVLPPVNGTVESGQLLISKSRHSETLLLSFYYNFYGPEYYYLLESQGAVGFGDKESFLNAALALNASHYLVHEGISALGYWDDGNFYGPAMVQYDLLQDYQNTILGHMPGTPAYVKPSIVFVHHNMLKLVPDNVFGGNGHEEYTKFRTNGKYHRIWGPKEDTEQKFRGTDMERVMWETLRDVTCGLKDRGLLGKENTSTNCEKCHDFVKEVFEQENTGL